MTVTLSKAQIEALKVELGKYGLDVRTMPKPRKANSVGKVLAKSKWYKRPSLAALGKTYPDNFPWVTTRYRFDRETGTYHAID
jgi:hypothetical protein